VILKPTYPTQKGGQLGLVFHAGVPKVGTVPSSSADICGTGEVGFNPKLAVLGFVMFAVVSNNDRWSERQVGARELSLSEVDKVLVDEDTDPLGNDSTVDDAVDSSNCDPLEDMQCREGRCRFRAHV